MADNTQGKSDKPKKISTLAFMLTKFESKPTAGGHQRYILTGTEVNGRDTKDKRLIAFQEVGVKLEGAMVDQGIDPARIDPALAITFTGSWQQKTVTPKDGTPFKAWEFKADDFAFGIQEQANEQPKADAPKADKPKAEPKPAKEVKADAPADAGGDKPKKEPKLLELTADRYETKTITNGSFCLNIYGRDDKGRKAHAVAWRATGEAMAEALNTFGAISEDSKVAIALTGFWKPSKWKNAQGQEKTNFEFVIQEFGQPMTVEQAAAAKAAQASKGASEKPAPEQADQSAAPQAAAPQAPKAKQPERTQSEMVM